MSKQKYTAHCMEFGYIYREIASEGRILAGLYNEEPVLIQDENAKDFMLSMGLEEEVNETEQMLANSNYVGRTTNFSELGQSGVGYSVNEPKGHDEDRDNIHPSEFIMDDIFTVDTLSWRNKEGTKVTVLMNGEVKGLKQGPAVGPNQNIEPLTPMETAELLDAINKTDLSTYSEEVLKASVYSLLVPELAKLLDKLEDYEEAMFNHNWNLGRWITNSDGTVSEPTVKKVDKWVGLRGVFNKNNLMSIGEETKYLEYMMARLKLTVKDSSIGGQWAHQDRYSMGARIGITDITKELSVQNRTKQQQYTDDDVILLEKAALEGESMFSKLFDKDGVNLGWGDKSRYYWRCSSDREQRFIKLQMYIVRAPLDILKKHFTGPDSIIHKKYTKSIKDCAPGPDSVYDNGRYIPSPLTGQEAVDTLVAKGFDRKFLTASTKYHKGEEWHKIWLKKEHINILDKMVTDRIKQETVTLADKFSGPKKNKEAVELLQVLMQNYKKNEERSSSK